MLAGQYNKIERLQHTKNINALKGCTRKNVNDLECTIFGNCFYLHATLKVIFAKTCCNHVDKFDPRNF